MQLIDIHPQYSDHLQFLAQKAGAPSLWQAETRKASRYSATEFSTADEALCALHEMQRLRSVFLAGLENDSAFRAVYEQFKPTLWPNFSSPPVGEALQQGLAARLYNVDPTIKDVAFLQIANGARRVGEILLEKCHANAVPVAVEIIDTNFLNLVLNHASDDGIGNLAKDYLNITAPVTKRITARAGMDDAAAVEQDVQKNRLYKALTKPFMDRLLSGEVFYTLTELPTRKTAEMDGMEYEDYIKLFFEMCDQPWQHIGEAQKNLIAELNAARALRFTNDDGTDVSVGIDGFTFCNSVVAKNVPGSEVFSGPERESINGRIVSKGRFSPPHDENAVIENLTLEFEKGRLVRWHADKGQKHFEDALGVDEGARYVGEIAIGTNPHLRRHVMNGLLVEKVGGSFHVALGNAYTFTKYGDDSVTVDNGNRSKIHWDITTLLYGKSGCIYIDDRKIMENGFFLDPAYDVLNRGWAALPQVDIPEHWQNHPTVKAAIERGPTRGAFIMPTTTTGIAP